MFLNKNIITIHCCNQSWHVLVTLQVYSSYLHACMHHEGPHFLFTLSWYNLYNGYVRMHEFIYIHLHGVQRVKVVGFSSDVTVKSNAAGLPNSQFWTRMSAGRVCLPSSSRLLPASS